MDQRRIVHRQLLISWATAGASLLCLLPSASIAYWRGYWHGTLREAPRYLFMDAFLAIMAGTLWLLGIGFFAAAVLLAFHHRERLSAVRVALVIMTLVAVPLTVYANGPGAAHHVEGFRDGVKSLAVDYEAIRRWRSQRSIPPSDIVPRDIWPPEIRKLDPQYVSVKPDGTVEIIYGGGFGHWGLSVHPSRDEPPRQYNVAPGVDAWYSE